MFILAAAYTIHKSNNLILHIFKGEHNPHSEIDYCNTIFSYFPAIFKAPISNNNTIIVQQAGVAFGPWDPTIYNKSCILDGYFQYYPAIKNYESELRSLFIQGLQTERTKLLQKFNFENVGFVHIRRGDYLKKANYHPIQPIEYYKKAVEIINKENPTCIFYIVSDDINWVKSVDFFNEESFTNYEGNELETLALMSLCTSGAICGNSTFSWWGAFLGAFERRHPVIAPKNFINEQMFENIFPEEWIII
jgi:hypothetical protein